MISKNRFSDFQEIHREIPPCFLIFFVVLDTSPCLHQDGTHHSHLTVHAPFNLAYQTARALAKAQKNPHFNKDGFHARVDVHNFDPSEITVKTVGNTIVIEAEHGDKEDELGTVRRHFIRKYILPKGYDMATVESLLSSDGVLTVKAPPPKPFEGEVRIVPIVQTNMPSKLKDN